MNAAVEEILERLYVLEVERQEVGVSDLVPETGLAEAVALGLVEKSDDAHRLSERGREMGRDVVRRHRLAERLLRDVVGDDPARVHGHACQFEHILLDGLDEQICILLGHPKTCPHGRPIPPGPCCERANADEVKEVTALCDGCPGADGSVVYLATRNKREVQKMMAMGILPGTPIQLIQRSPSYVFQLGYGQFAVDRRLAAVIIVRWRPQNPRSAP